MQQLVQLCHQSLGLFVSLTYEKLSQIDLCQLIILKKKTYPITWKVKVWQCDVELFNGDSPRFCNPNSPKCPFKF